MMLDCKNEAMAWFFLALVTVLVQVTFRASPRPLGQSQQEWREVDHPAEEGAGLPLLGEHHPGHAGRAIHGRRGDLRRRGVCPLSGGDSDGKWKQSLVLKSYMDMNALGPSQLTRPQSL